MTSRPRTIEPEPDWFADAHCRTVGPAVMYPLWAKDQQTVADTVCARCPVTETCLEYALAQRIDDGVWGGRTEPQRRTILKRRAERRRMETASAS
jgi:WhiB family transcriptional regulator, redox-sensing transcriptional regulator